MRLFTLPVLLAVGAAALAIARDAPDPTRDSTAIAEAVQSYFDGMMQANPAHLRRAFHADARLIGVGENGGALIIPFERWAASWEGRDPRDTSTHRNTIVSIDVAGNAASVKTDLAWPSVHYVDYLSLLEIDGEWKIVNKIWWEERR